jgi:hypothetical protein
LKALLHIHTVQERYPRKFFFISDTLLFELAKDDNGADKYQKHRLRFSLRNGIKRIFAINAGGKPTSGRAIFEDIRPVPALNPVPKRGKKTAVLEETDRHWQKDPG